MPNNNSKAVGGRRSPVNPQITDAEILAMEAEEGKHKTPRVDPEVARAYSAYLSDWKQRMYTHMKLQREYMGSSRY